MYARQSQKMKERLIVFLVITLSWSYILHGFRLNLLKKSSILSLHGHVDVAVVIIDHGSKVQEANDALGVFCQMYAERSKLHVEPAHMELAEPTIKTACERCVDQGARKIICFPYFLSKGRHVQTDIPKQIREIQEIYPNIEITLSEPLGSQVDALLTVVDSVIRSEAE